MNETLQTKINYEAKPFLTPRDVNAWADADYPGVASMCMMQFTGGGTLFESFPIVGRKLMEAKGRMIQNVSDDDAGGQKLF